jgi:hypothetical protein
MRMFKYQFAVVIEDFHSERLNKLMSVVGVHALACLSADVNRLKPGLQQFSHNLPAERRFFRKEAVKKIVE